MTKKSYIFFGVFLLLTTLEYSLLNKMFSKDLYHVSFKAKHTSSSLPTFNLGYLERTENNLRRIVIEKNLDCRSLVLKISSEVSHVFYDINMYCKDPKSIENSLSPKLSNLFKVELGKESFFTNIEVTSLTLENTQSSPKSKLFMLTLSIIFSVLVIMTFPFSIFWEKNS